MNNFEIGQVVFILTESQPAIIPGMVVEECVVKKLDGNTISWKVRVGGPNNFKLLDSEKINGTIYGSLEEVKTKMMSNFTEFVDKLVVEGEKKIEEWFGPEVAEKQRNRILNGGSTGSILAPQMEKMNPDQILQSLEKRDGSSSVGVVDSSNTTALIGAAASKEAALAKLRKMAEVEEEKQEVVTITDENGITRKVSMPKNLP